MVTLYSERPIILRFFSELLTKGNKARYCYFKYKTKLIIKEKQKIMSSLYLRQMEPIQTNC